MKPPLCSAAVEAEAKGRCSAIPYNLLWVPNVREVFQLTGGGPTAENTYTLKVEGSSSCSARPIFWVNVPTTARNARSASDGHGASADRDPSAILPAKHAKRREASGSRELTQRAKVLDLGRAKSIFDVFPATPCWKRHRVLTVLRLLLRDCCETNDRPCLRSTKGRMKATCARRALVLLLLQAHVAAFSGPSPR